MKLKETHNYPMNNQDQGMTTIKIFEVKELQDSEQDGSSEQILEKSPAQNVKPGRIAPQKVKQDQEKLQQLIEQQHQREKEVAYN